MTRYTIYEDVSGQIEYQINFNGTQQELVEKLKEDHWKEIEGIEIVNQDFEKKRQIIQ